MARYWLRNWLLALILLGLISLIGYLSDRGNYRVPVVAPTVHPQK